MPNLITSFRGPDMSCYHAYRAKARSFPSHIHNVYEILFLKKGTATYTVEGKAYPISRHSLVLIRPLAVHSVVFSEASEYERYNILFDEKILSAGTLQQIPKSLNVISFDGNTVVTDLFRKIDYYCMQLSDTRLNTVLTHLVEEILVNVSIAAREQQAQNQYTANELVKQAVKYIDRNLTNPLTVEDVCKELHISQSYLLQLFDRYLNISPKKYIMSKRLTMAQMAIRSGTKPTDAYRQCGFSDYSTFFRGYVRYLGHSPSEELEHPLTPVPQD